MGIDLSVFGDRIYGERERVRERQGTRGVCSCPPPHARTHAHTRKKGARASAGTPRKNHGPAALETFLLTGISRVGPDVHNNNVFFLFSCIAPAGLDGSGPGGRAHLVARGVLIGSDV